MAYSGNKKAVRWHRYNDVRKYLRTICVIILSCVLVWGFFLYLSRLGPGKAKTRPSLDSTDPVEAVGLLHAIDPNMSAEELRAFSAELEAEAQQLVKVGDFSRASVKYEQAFQLQKRIKQSYPLSPHNDASRLIRLKLESKNAIAEPFFRNSLDLEQQASRLADAGDRDSALELLKQALSIQQQLNGEYSDALQASALRLKELRNKLAELESSELHAEIKEFVERATLLQESGNWKDAGEHFQQAARLQEQLNEEFPSSPRASLVRVTEFRHQGQVAQSALLAREIQDASSLIEQSLTARRIREARQTIDELNQKLQTFEQVFPLSSRIDETLKVRLNYLHLKSADLETIQDQVYAALLPVPSITGTRMLRTEIPQSLYFLLTDANPSRNQAGSNPVDSISWFEAKAFCEKLSWTLGKKVRLPKEDEFRKALGDLLDYSDIESFAWSTAEAKGFSQPVGQKKPSASGHFDLLGNVSEWLEPDGNPGSDKAYHIGGNVQDRSGTIGSVPVRELEKSERSRMTGFRVVVLD